MEQLLAHLRTLLQCVCTDPAQPLASIDLLSTEERNTQLIAWNDTETDFGDFAAVHELFERQVDKTPDAVALRFEGESMTYAELDRRSNQLARHLCDQGVAPGGCVALVLERSFEMQIAIFGVLKAGAAYVPLDPEYPEDRVVAVLEDCGAKIVVGDSQWSANVAAARVQTVWLDRLGTTLQEQEASRLELAIDPESLAYIIFTSGSTGRPKGVMISHESISNFSLSLVEAQAITDADVYLQTYPYTFDPSCMGLFSPLAVGATLVYPKPGGHKVPSYMAALLQEEKATITSFVPSVLEVMLESSNAASWKSLRVLISGGEVLTPALRDAFHARTTAQLLNVYGPTETTVLVSVWPCDRDAPLSGSLPIGWPTANVQLYVLDTCMQPVPAGVVGEL